MQTRLLGVEVKKVKQVETMLLSLIPASKIKEQRERPWSTVKSLGLLHLLTKHFCLMLNRISLNSQKVHGISKVTIYLFIYLSSEFCAHKDFCGSGPSVAFIQRERKG